MPVIVTRPQQEAAQWSERLRAQGVDALALPLIEIAAAPDAGALDDARRHIARYAAAMFVSANAVRGFFAGGFALPAPVRAWAPGPGTAEALAAAGVPAACIDSPPGASGQFDSESLWPLVRAQVTPGSRVLLVRGADAQGQAAGRDWLAQQIEAAGAQVDSVAAYSRRGPRWSAAEQALAARSAQDGSTWLFSSSEAIANLCALLPGQDWAAAHALATHPRIADAARAAGFGSVRLCRPAFDDVLASLK